MCKVFLIMVILTEHWTLLVDQMSFSTLLPWSGSWLSTQGNPNLPPHFQLWYGRPSSSCHHCQQVYQMPKYPEKKVKTMCVFCKGNPQFHWFLFSKITLIRLFFSCPLLNIKVLDWRDYSWYKGFFCPKLLYLKCQIKKG